MSNDSGQSMAEKIELQRIWEAHPKVVAFTAALREHARQDGLTGVEGMNATAAFARAWTREHGDLPESGIICDG